MFSDITLLLLKPYTICSFLPRSGNLNLSETPGAIRRPAPLLGEHNNYVFGELLLGLPENEIEELVQEKVIF